MSNLFITSDDLETEQRPNREYSERAEREEREEAPVPPRRGNRFRVMAPNRAGELVSKTTVQLRQLVEQQSKTGEIGDHFLVRLIPLDQTVTQQRVGMIVFAVKKESVLNSRWTYQVLMLAESGTIPDMLQRIGPDEYPLTLTPADLWSYNDVVKTIAANAVKQHCLREGDSPAKLIGPLILPVGFDPENPDTIWSLLDQLMLAANTTIEKDQSDFQDWSIELNIDKTPVEIELCFGQQDVPDDIGQVNRSDVLVKLAPAVRSRRTEESPVITTEDLEPYTHASLYGDLVYDPEGTVRDRDGRSVWSTKTYFPRLNLTDIYTYDLCSETTVLMALVTAYAAAQNQNWMNLFWQEPGQQPIPNYRDVGILNIETDAYGEGKDGGTKLDTKNPDKFGRREFEDFMQRVFREPAYFAIDIPEAGSSTWYLKFLVDALIPGKNGDKFRDRLYDAACRLTGGVFEEYFRRSDEYFETVTTRIHLGYWRDPKTQVVRDIRHVDRLLLMNQNPARVQDIAAEWDETFYSDRLLDAQMLALRERLIKAATGGLAVITGYAIKPTFTPTFVSALVKASQEAGFRPSVRTSGLAVSDFQTRHASARFSGARGQVSPDDFSTRGGRQSGSNRWDSSGIYRGNRRSRY